jgi:diguanylate cyclase (GGDEF)-like protein/PAS domain S-box-containing protein
MTIGVLTPVLDGYYFGNLLKSISYKAQQFGMKVVVIGTSANYYSEAYASAYVDGWIVIMDAVNEIYLDKLRRLGKPILGINTTLPVDYAITNNNREAMDDAIEHLFHHGHRRIAYVGDAHFYDARERYSGYRSALAKRQIVDQPEWFFDIFQMSPEQVVRSMVENGLPWTAVIAVNDSIAIELIKQFIARNVKVPEQVAVIGFDDVPISRTTTPALSTFRMPVSSIGSQAVEVLRNLLEGEPVDDSLLRIQSSLVYRRSCGCKTDQPEEPNDEQAEVIQFLDNMIARNFNLGLLMQSYNFKQTMDMSWLYHSAVRRGFVALNEVKRPGGFSVYRFILHEDKTKAELDSAYGEPASFPPYEALHNDDFMSGENVVLLIPIVQYGQELGALAFVGLGDVTTLLNPLNTTFQLANFFASALHRESMDEEMQSYSHQLEIISSITHDGIWIYDVSASLISIRGGIHKILGYDDLQHPVQAVHYKSLIHSDDLAAMIHDFKHHLEQSTSIETECRIRHAQGHYIWVQLSAFGQLDSSGRLVQILGSIKNISERKASEERIRQLAYGDPLTGLANRLSFEQQLEAWLKEAGANETKVGVLLFDLDRFKWINDSYGHQAGDRLLQYVAKEVTAVAGESNLVARLGGDEFVIVISHLDSVQDALQLGNQVVERLRLPFLDGDREYYISCSVGISIFPDDAEDAQSMIKHADIAMYNAKSMGRNRAELYMPGNNDYLLDRIQMETNLRKAIERKEFVLYYQPQLDMSTGRISSVEALIRWNSPEFGFVQPLDFIPLAEETGLIIPIGEWVLREACLLNRRLMERGLSPIRVAVNISAKQLNQGNLVHMVQTVLKETKNRPEYLCLEITESNMLKDIQSSSNILQELILLGVQISLDDFGTGYSSLSLLKSLPIDIIKIDKSFISDITVNEENKAIVHAIIQMSHILSLDVIAEGIETMEQMSALDKLKVDNVQGYFISKPVPFDSLVNLLAQRGQHS